MRTGNYGRTKYAVTLWSDGRLVEQWTFDARTEAKLAYEREMNLMRTDRGVLYSSGEHAEVRFESGVLGEEQEFIRHSFIDRFSKQF